MDLIAPCVTSAGRKKNIQLKCFFKLPSSIEKSTPHFGTPVDCTVGLLFLGTCRLSIFRSSHYFWSWAYISIDLGVIVGSGVDTGVDQFAHISSRGTRRGEAHLGRVARGLLQGSMYCFPTISGPLTDLHQLKAGLSTARTHIRWENGIHGFYMAPHWHVFHSPNRNCSS